MRAASFLYGPMCPTKQNDMRINLLAGPSKSLLVFVLFFFLTGTEENFLFSLLEKVRICEPRFPVAMTQASSIKLAKENIIEVKEKYGPGIRSHAIWVSCSGCSRVIASLRQAYLFLLRNPPFQPELVWVVFISLARKNYPLSYTEFISPFCPLRGKGVEGRLAIQYEFSLN